MSVLQRSLYIFLGVLALTLANIVWGPAGLLGSLEEADVILRIRLWRALTAVSVGAMLGLAGYLMQYSVSNELASPDILGVLPGANAAAVAVTLAFNGSPPLGLTLAAGFAGGMMAYAASIALAARLGLTRAGVVLAGIAVAGVASGVSAVLTLIAEAKLGVNAALILLGSFAYSTRVDALVSAATLVASTLAALALVKGLDLISYGDDVAEAAGYNPRITRALACSLAALLSSASVYAAGIVGFVSLIAPNIARLIAGGHPAASFIPSMLVGSLIAIAADTFGKLGVTVGVGEIPAGLVTTMFGGLFLAYMLLKTSMGVSQP